jgi:hypothetical protein
MAQGGALAGSSANPTYVFNSTPSGGAMAAGHGWMYFSNIMSGGAVVTGFNVGHIYSETGIGGVLATSVDIIEEDHIFIEAECPPSTMLCGYINDDQFCAELEDVQAFGSTLSHQQRRDLRAIAITPPGRPISVYGSVAKLPAITFCRQKIRTKPADFPPQRIVAKPQEPVLTMLSADIPPIVPESAPIRTPQMAVLKRYNLTKRQAVKPPIVVKESRSTVKKIAKQASKPIVPRSTAL